ncbi:GSCFA domain-containing protein [Hymenobacter qilianensis]|uniref:GSCFA domain-containing protein n=1 Tax=Hymenobacter qilianensis TaxID=1385715 RepID=UPI001CB9CD3E|nr:GSCFA domain-containing protein [Hymenobacter qilianensis]
MLTIGSCFSDVLGNRLSNYKVRSLANPFGTVFNPLSACKLLRAAAGEETDWQQHLVPARGRWQSYDLHATVGSDSPVELLQHIQELMQRTGQFLETADVVVLTLGTAYAYRLRETQEIVSNCHKVPADQFEKELLTPDEIINAIAETHALLRRRNPKLRFVLTVSPVRHIKDTLPLNAVSKSILRVACHYLSELLPDVTYFPAYELLMDDLRDYRFYAADMIHPTAVAEEYVWERFSREYFDSNFGRFLKEWDAVRQAMAHRPLYPASPEHRQFLEATLTRLQRLGNQVDVRPEIREVQKQLHSLPAPIKPHPIAVPEVDEEERIDIGEAENAPSV